MSLPKSNHPLFEAKLPSTQKSISFRQMLVRDEKILLMAKSSGEESDINRAVKQVVNNCVMESNIDKFTTFDIEYMFVKIRSVSIGNVIELGFVDKEDEEEYDFEVNLDEVEIRYPDWFNQEGVTNLITTEGDDKLGIVMRWPPAALFDESIAAERGDDAYEFIAAKCIEKIFEGDEVHLSEDYSIDELIEFIKDLDTKTYDKIKRFISSTPHLYYEINYKNSKGTDRKIALTTLTDFFTLR